MSDEQTGNETRPRSWIDRIAQIFSDEPTDTGSLLEVLRNAAQDNVLDADALSIIEGALQVSNMQVREIMIPRPQVVTVSARNTLEEVLDIVVTVSHSRFPVVAENSDSVIGILLAKDLLPFALDKNGSIDASISSLPLVSANSFARAGAKAQSAAGFSGKGATENTNDFSGTITVIVTRVLPNGHLQIAGEKQIGVNSNVDVLRFTGQVDPRTIQPGNVVPSTQIANVRVEHRGRGAQGEATSVGWLSRFFLSLWPI